MILAILGCQQFAPFCQRFDIIFNFFITSFYILSMHNAFPTLLAETDIVKVFKVAKIFLILSVSKMLSVYIMNVMGGVSIK